MCQTQNVSNRFWPLNLVSIDKSSLCIFSHASGKDKTSSSVNCTSWINYRNAVMERGLRTSSACAFILNARLSDASRFPSLCPFGSFLQSGTVSTETLALLLFSGSMPCMGAWKFGYMQLSFEQRPPCVQKGGVVLDRFFRGC